MVQITVAMTLFYITEVFFFFFLWYHNLLENIVALLKEIEEAIHAIWLLTQKEKGAYVKTDNRKKAV